MPRTRHEAAAPGEQSRPVSLSRQALSLLIGRGFGFVFSFAIPLVLVRALTETAFGEYKEFFLLGTTTVRILTFGIPASLFYFLPAEGKERGRYVTAALLLLGGTGSVVVLTGLAFGASLVRLLGAGTLGPVVPLLATYMALMLVTDFVEQLAVIEQRAYTAGVVAFLSEASRAALLMLAAVHWSSIHAIAWAAVAYASLRAVFLLGYAGYIYRTELFRITPAAPAELFRYAAPFGLATMVETLLVYLHQFFVASRTDAATFAVYAVGCFQVPIMYLIYAAAADPALVRATEHYKSGELENLATLFRTVLRHLGFLLVPGYTIIAVFAPAIVEVLFTARFLGAVPVLVVFSLTLLLYSADHIVLRAMAETRFILKANVLGLVVNALALFPLYKLAGLPGVAASHVLGLMTARAGGLLKAASVLDRPVRELVPTGLLARIVVAAAAAGAGAHEVVRAFPPLQRLLLGIPAFGAGYLLLAVVLGAVSAEELRTLWAAAAARLRVRRSR